MTNSKKGYVRILGIFSVVFLSFGALPAQAQNWYGGFSFGNFDHDAFGEKDTGLKLFAGYQFSKTSAFEFGYVDLGEVTITGPGGTASVESTGFTGSLVGHLPVAGDKASVFGKIGLFMWSSDLTGNIPSLGGLLAVSDDGVDLTYGIGFQWKVGKTAAVRVEWEHFDDDGDFTTGDMLSLGVTFGF